MSAVGVHPAAVAWARAERRYRFRRHARCAVLRGAFTFAILMWLNIGVHVYVWLGGVS